MRGRESLRSLAKKARSAPEHHKQFVYVCFSAFGGCWLHVLEYMIVED